MIIQLSYSVKIRPIEIVFSSLSRNTKQACNGTAPWMTGTTDHLDIDRRILVVGYITCDFQRKHGISRYERAEYKQ
ncbi:hypothetical protein ANCCAN_29721 [Ancylostoma caninum]|uniref:Uncharacterized protein n=1 Tax=Ancylostoma caninum TaxID=29170 RepID=A0A368EXS2_ANCCA|nr:hypothetical protein ANCCAN_29721 [Ancylostoma caninum]